MCRGVVAVSFSEHLEDFSSTLAEVKVHSQLLNGSCAEPVFSTVSKQHFNVLVGRDGPGLI